MGLSGTLRGQRWGVFPVRIKLLPGGHKVLGFFSRPILEAANHEGRMTGVAFIYNRAPVLPLAISPQDSNRPTVTDKGLPVNDVKPFQNSLFDLREHRYSPVITKH
jgi:hypothetical protein